MSNLIKELQAVDQLLDTVSASLDKTANDTINTVKEVFAEQPGAPQKPPMPPEPKKEEKKESPYDIRKEETIDTTRSFAENAYDSVLESLDSIGIFKMRLEMISQKEAFRINKENSNYLVGIASEIEKTLETAYNQAENLMLAIEAGKLG
jgi:hypothetical protein